MNPPTQPDAWTNQLMKTAIPLATPWIIGPVTIKVNADTTRTVINGIKIICKYDGSHFLSQSSHFLASHAAKIIGKIE